MPDALAIATFRFELIGPLIDPTLGKTARRTYLAGVVGKPVRWPSGESQAVGRSTLYRWAAAYRRAGLEGLMPTPRADRGKPRVDREAAVEKAVQLLLERPDRSLNLVLALLEAEAPALPSLSRSTLHRALQAHPVYAAVQRERAGARRLRTRFEAAAPHDIWQLDAKGPVTVRIAGVDVKATFLSILDDHSRALLAIGVAQSEALGPAVKVFRVAVARWGAPARVYCDRHSAYDTDAFRSGLAVLGVHRIASRPRNPQARGKIERYHGFLDAWFLRELPHQEVVSLAHLEALAEAFAELLYNAHRHRGLRATPSERLAGRVSPRHVCADTLARAFWVEKRRKAHPRTGEVALPGGTFRVPAAWAGKRVRLRYDPVELDRVRLVRPSGVEVTLAPITPRRPAQTPPGLPPSAPGRLQRLLDNWRGRSLPSAEPAFGLPEVFAALASYVGRAVPDTQREAETVQAFYRVNGPFRRDAFEAALERARSALGVGRPLQIVLAYLVREARPRPTSHKEDEL